jgi:hypothetical protein
VRAPPELRACPPHLRACPSTGLPAPLTGLPAPLTGLSAPISAPAVISAHQALDPAARQATSLKRAVRLPVRHASEERPPPPPEGSAAHRLVLPGCPRSEPRP